MQLIMISFKNISQLAAITALASLLLLSSCKDALQEDPKTFYSETQVFATEEGLETAVNGMYSHFFDPGYYGSSWHGLLMPHSGKFWSNQGASTDATSLNCTPINVWLIRLWPQMYSTINVANVLMDNLEENEAGLPNRDIAMGQAYFIRALTYFDLVRLFGGVPIRTKPTDIDALHLSRSSKEEVYDLIISDLEMAKQMLPDPGEYRPERPTKIVASAYLARVYMTLASEEGADQNLWNEAYQEAIAVYNSGMYSLLPTFAELFEPGNENTVESIFEIQYGHTGGIRNTDMPRMYTPSNSTFVPSSQATFGRIRPNKETFDAHVSQYPDDPRIDATYIYDSYERSNGNTQTIYPTRTTGRQAYPCIRKWLDPSYNGTTSDRNYIHFRYADLLLMLAEIENELNGPAGAYQYVNPVLARARDTDGDGTADAAQPADWAGMSQDEFRSRILQERHYELLSEGQDWFDVRRRGYRYFLENVVEPHNNHPTFDQTTDFAYPISIKNMLLPIPSIELSGNQAMSVADQNPGY